MKKLIFSLVMALGLIGVGSFATTSTVMADSGACGNGSVFFALKPWYDGWTTTINDRCEIRWPTSGEMPKFVWSVVLNILYDISMLVGYITVIMVAWGGYLYMFSRGEPGRAEKGKKTLISAMIGLAIAMLAGVIMNTIAAILTGSS